MKTAFSLLTIPLTALAVLGAATAPAAADDLVVDQVQAAQRPGTALVDVWYRLVTVGGGPAWVSVFLSTDGGATYPHLCQTVTGDIGPGVLPGDANHVVWDAGGEYPGYINANCRIRVKAYDDETIQDFVALPAGTFAMGSPPGEPGREGEEVLHQVTLTHGFEIHATEVTNRQFAEMAQWAYDHGYVTVAPPYYNVLRDNLDGSTATLKYLGSGNYGISFSDGTFSSPVPDNPVRWLTWYAAAAYCDWLSLQQGRARAYDHATWQCNGGAPYAASGYRLPTEAEREYACRAGSSTAFANGPITATDCAMDPNLDLMGWYCGNAGGAAHAVALKSPNAWGLYDMHGNEHEWCNDWYADYTGDATDPVGPASGSTRVLRGGGYSAYAHVCRSAFRDAIAPGNQGDIVGFRPARSTD